MYIPKLRKSHDRVLLISDLHCGARTGLTPPPWHQRVNDESAWPEFLSDSIREKFVETQVKTWRWFENAIREVGPVRLAICLGDAIDGDGKASGGQEQITPDHSIQAEMAIKAISIINTKAWCFVFGTPYHTGKASHQEMKIAQWYADRLPDGKVTIGAHEWPDVSGWVFDVKHKVGGSTIPHGRSTSIMKEDLWNLAWNDLGGQPRSDILVRGHVHYFNVVHRNVKGRRKYMATMPALQALGTNYGGEQCSGTVDYGFCFVDVPKNEGNPQWEEVLMEMEAQAAQTTKF
jgi:hypothetical protein